MKFELTEALINDILFSMEDQMGEYYIDTVEGTITGGMDNDFLDEEDDNEDRYISLPDWQSSDGFQLMEHFTAGFKNPVIRRELSSALNRGRGVFRAFKDTLEKYPEAEKLWFSFKEHQMRKEIIDWYNALREEWSMEKIGSEPEETGDLVLEDFRFRMYEKNDIDAIRELHKSCTSESSIDTDTNTGINEVDLHKSLVWCAESSGGDFAGFISVIQNNNNYKINYLEVLPEYRGLGIGESLLKKCLDNIDTGNHSVVIDLPSEAEGFSRVLARENFQPCMIRHILHPNTKNNK